MQQAARGPKYRVAPKSIADGYTSRISDGAHRSWMPWGTQPGCILADVDADGREGLRGLAGVARHGLLLPDWGAKALQANPPFRGSSRSIPLAEMKEITQGLV